MKSRVLAVVLWIGCLGPVFGQIGWGSFTNYSIKDGLSQSTVTSIFQDSNGFIWLGTSDGLNKFDGQKFTIYKNNYKDPNSLSDNWIFAILKEDSKNNLWIFTADWNLNKFNLRNHEIRRYSLKLERVFIHQPLKQIYSFEEDAEKNLWLSTNRGVFKYISATDSFKTYFPFPTQEAATDNIVWSFTDTHGSIWFGSNLGLCKYNSHEDNFTYYAENKSNPTSLLSNHILRMVTFDKKTWVITKEGISLYNEKSNNFTSFPYPQAILSQKPTFRFKTIVADKAGNIWVGTNVGLIQFNTSKQVYQVFQQNKTKKGSISSNEISAIFQDKSGNIWVGTIDGLNKYEPGKEHFMHYFAEPGFSENNFVSDILELRNNEIWIVRKEINDAKMCRLNKVTGFIESLPSNTCDPNSLSNSQISSVFADKSGNLWLGTFGNSAFKYTPRSGKFAHYFSVPGNQNTLKENSIWGFSEDKKGNIWIAMHDGTIAKFDTVSKHFTNYPLFKNGIKNFTITNLVVDANGEIWIASVMGGLIRFNPQTGRVRHYLNNPNDSTSISSNLLFMITIDKSGKIWIAHAVAGIDIFDPQTETFTHLTHNPGNTNSLSNNSVWSILQDYKGNMWIATDGAVDFYEPSKKRFTHYYARKEISGGLLNDKALCIYDDRKGNIWFGTSGGGLSKFNTSTKKFIHYTESEGLANNVIYGIVGDNEGNLWLSTNRGLSRFNIQNQTFTNYRENAGLQSDEFNQSSYFRSSTGKIYFGGINGFNVFTPTHITKDSIAPETLITGLLVSDKQVRVKARHKMKQNDTICDCKLMRDSSGYYLPMDIVFSQHITIPYSAKVLTLQFAAIAYNNPEGTAFRYKMENFDDDWHYTSDINAATYTNLAPGNYVFKVSAANSDGVFNTRTRDIVITITPPFWKTWWFLILEIAAIIAAIWLFIRLRERNLKHSKVKLEAKVKERTRRIEEINEELRLRNAEINRQKEEIALQAGQLKKELTNQNAVSEMGLLKSQINPHFLFNTLNNIYSLVYQKSEDAPSAVMRLSELMRYMVYETNSVKVALEKEINYLKSFIELQLLRLRNKDYAEFNIEGNIYGKTIAPMLLIPFVENAFKHGNKKAPNPGIIINLAIEDKGIRFDVTNYYQNGAVNKDEIGGIGIENVKRRLELIHPNSHVLNISQTESQYKTHLEITLQ
ncbi:MAG TPA: two-component regulator propeller domain-containing protein [Bacteroidales bacterium]|nr:two-component regulator propeller domain-containing protein [Bacteroidales bacterium]